MIHDMKRTSTVDTVTGEVRHKRVYLAGPMSGYPEFNFPAFMAKAAELRGRGWEVFNPAEKDMERHGTDISKGNGSGSVEQAAKEHGFSLNVALREDLSWICDHADAIYMMKGWERSSGARTEWTLACCLRLEIIYE